MPEIKPPKRGRKKPLRAENPVPPANFLYDDLQRVQPPRRAEPGAMFINWNPDAGVANLQPVPPRIEEDGIIMEEEDLEGRIAQRKAQMHQVLEHAVRYRVHPAPRVEVPRKKPKPVIQKEGDIQKDTKVEILFPFAGGEVPPVDFRKRLKLSLDPDVTFPYEHPIGIEIEVENYKWPQAKFREAVDGERNEIAVVGEAFNHKQDGSLRNNGIEFVSKFGICSNDVPKYLKLLHSLLMEAQRENDMPVNRFTFRCGLHIHIDVSSLTMEDLYKAFLVYTVLEPLLFEVSGGRVSNKFCVSVQESVNAVGNMLYYGQRGRWKEFADALIYSNKYMAMNIKTVHQYGTIEFRHHYGTSDPDVILPWMLALLDVVVNSSKLNKDTLEKEILELNTDSQYELFLRRVAPNSFHLLRTDRFERKMYDGVAYIKECFAGTPEDISHLRDHQ